MRDTMWRCEFLLLAVGALASPVLAADKVFSVDANDTEFDMTGVRHLLLLDTAYPRPLNDTGITWGGNFPSGNNTTCASNINASQDCHQGMDATHNDNSDGHGGFSFTDIGQRRNFTRAGNFDLRIGLIDTCLKISRINLDQQGTGGDAGIICHFYRLDITRQLRADSDAIRLYIGIIGRLQILPVAAVIEIPPAPVNQATNGKRLTATHDIF